MGDKRIDTQLVMACVNNWKHISFVRAQKIDTGFGMGMLL